MYPVEVCRAFFIVHCLIIWQSYYKVLVLLWCFACSFLSILLIFGLLCFWIFWFISTVNKDGFKPNLETHLIPLLAKKVDNASAETKDKINMPSSKDAHHQQLLQVTLCLLAILNICLATFSSKRRLHCLKDF